MSNRKTVLTIAAHPDDEVLGCGGTLAKHVMNGDDVHTFIVAEGATSRDVERNTENQHEEIESLRNHARKAAKTLGTITPTFGGLPDNRLDSVDLLDLVKLLEDVIGRLAPSIIYTHHGGDLNIDHRLVYQAVLTACRPLPEKKSCRILTFETASSTEWAGPSIESFFQPNWFVSIEVTLARKLSALEAYAPEMREPPHPRSIESVELLAKLRGTQIGVFAAEAFMLVREIR
jgi:N-acetylglucosamine malate deacetylase 1